MEILEKYLKALVLLQLDTLEGEQTKTRPELILNKAGFSAKDIAGFLGKSEAATAKAISRAKTAEREGRNGSK